MVEVRYDASTQHWVFVQMFTSAHKGKPTDHSRWSGLNEVGFSSHYGGHPIVWVSTGKHANYISFNECNGYGIVDSCSWGPLDAFRFPINETHNVGSRFVHFLDCVASEELVSPKYECFWSPQTFRGWQTQITGDDPQPYSDWLLGYYFENRGFDSGPGPDAPPLSPSGPLY
jgi:hypothetical protein